MMAITSRARSKLARLLRERFSNSHCTFAKNSRGTDPAAWIPSKSGAPVAMIETAMPGVNPLVTGQGMNLIRLPMRANPMTIWSMPAMIVAAIKPP
jgi:hypothetical protein